jgi:hypothetical protein
MERAAHARAVATAKGRRVGRPVLVDPAKLEWAAHLRESGSTIAEIIGGSLGCVGGEAALSRLCVGLSPSFCGAARLVLALRRYVVGRVAVSMQLVQMAVAAVRLSPPAGAGVLQYLGSGYLNPGDVLLAAGVEASLRSTALGAAGAAAQALGH